MRRNARVPGVSALFAASGDLANFQATVRVRRTTRAINIVHDAAIRLRALCDRSRGAIGRTLRASRPAVKPRRSRAARPPSLATWRTPRASQKWARTQRNLNEKGRP